MAKLIFKIDIKNVMNTDLRNCNNFKNFLNPLFFLAYPLKKFEIISFFSTQLLIFNCKMTKTFSKNYR